MTDALREACNRIFEYPPSPPPRRHGPKGYAECDSYKPWLRDEFAFRCAYCLWRENWEADGHHSFGVEHIVPRSASAELELEYANLLYACNTCNSSRRDVSLPVDLAKSNLVQHLELLEDGQVLARSEAGEDIVDICRLNRPILVLARRRILNLVRVLQTSTHPDAVRAIKELLAFPPDLPNLKALRPPKGNSRPEGISQSYFELRQTDALPEF